MIDIDKENKSNTYRALIADKLRRVFDFWIDEITHTDPAVEYLDIIGQDMIAMISFLLETRHKGE